MKILITGCAGFIGSHLTECFLNDGHIVIGVDNFDPFYSKEQKIKNLSFAHTFNSFSFHLIDIREAAQLNTLPTDIEIVIHLAAKAGVRPSIIDPIGYNDTNVKGTLNVLEWMRLCGITKMVFASSSSVYGNNKKTPFSETDNVDTPISPYAFTKKSCE
ncbi:MAG TPA: GDP-mannose 4,6-dehydratase, partial [Bacteroidia bacterium]|nr:GDP-mannose 4,6-dehydratase [Bacteroidia bacterium]